jgi:VIT1/CCC1 family predicted Fe2+/Mn2+ transporter
MDLPSKKNTSSTKHLKQQTHISIKHTGDPLIARSWQRVQYVGITMLLLSFIAVIGFFSHKAEYALIFSLVLSSVLIFVILTILLTI